MRGSDGFWGAALSALALYARGSVVGCASDGAVTAMMRDGGAADAEAAATDAGSQIDSSHRDGDVTRRGDANVAHDGGRTGPTARSCFEGEYESPRPLTDFGPDYDAFGPRVGAHCLGTDHQDIRDVERVVFLGDSMTVGTPPTAVGDYYRGRLADALAAHFGLEAPDGSWRASNPLDGRAVVRASGDFVSCARWGAVTRDLLGGDNQIEDCFPQADRHLRQLVIITMGGNDLQTIVKDGFGGAETAALWDEARALVTRMRTAVQWLKSAGRFPGGLDVVFANIPEFTDGTGDFGSCPAAGAFGFSGTWNDPDAMEDVFIWVNEQYMSIAVDTGSDMAFVLEEFCGHGFHRDDPTAPCYRGAGSAHWFDPTCIHPNTAGHARIAEMFMAIVRD